MSKDNSTDHHAGAAVERKTFDELLKDERATLRELMAICFEELGLPGVMNWRNPIIKRIFRKAKKELKNIQKLPTPTEQKAIPVSETLVLQRIEAAFNNFYETLLARGQPMILQLLNEAAKHTGDTGDRTENDKLRDV